MEWWIIFGAIIYLMCRKPSNQIVIEEQPNETITYNLNVAIVVVEHRDGAISKPDVLWTQRLHSRTINHE